MDKNDTICNKIPSISTVVEADKSITTEIIPAENSGDFIIANETPFPYPYIESFTGYYIDDVQDIIGNKLSGGRYVDQYCTIWKVGDLYPSPTPSVTPSISVSASVTPTPTPSTTTTATMTPTPSVSVSASVSMTPTPSTTNTMTMTPTPSTTSTATMTPTPSVSMSASVTPTPTPSTTNTMTMTPTPSVTSSQGSSPTPTPSNTPSISVSASVSMTPTPSTTNTMTMTPTPSTTNTMTMTPTPSTTSTMTATPTPSVTPTISDSATPTPTPTASTTNTMTATPTPTPTISESASVTPTPTPSTTSTTSVTPTPTPSTTNTMSMTPTPSVSFSATMTPTPSVSQSASVTPTPTISQSASVTPTPSVSFSASVTPTPTQSPTPSALPPTPTPSSSAPVQLTNGGMWSFRHNNGLYYVQNRTLPNYDLANPNIQTTGEGYPLGVTKDGKTGYIRVAQSVLVVDMSNFTVSRTITGISQGIARTAHYCPATHRIYVQDTGTNTVMRIINPDTGAVGTTNIPGATAQYGSELKFIYNRVSDTSYVAYDYGPSNSSLTFTLRSLTQTNISGPLVTMVAHDIKTNGSIGTGPYDPNIYMVVVSGATYRIHGYNTLTGNTYLVVGNLTSRPVVELSLYNGTSGYVFGFLRNLVIRFDPNVINGPLTQITVTNLITPVAPIVDSTDNSIIIMNGQNLIQKLNTSNFTFDNNWRTLGGSTAITSIGAASTKPGF